MIVYRVCRRPYATLDGEGARQYGGRWNSVGVAMVYASEHPALAVLETLVHLDLSIDLIPDDYVALRIELPNLSFDRGPNSTAEDESAVGDEWIRSGRSLALLVHSVVAPLSQNVLLNPAHPGMRDVRADPPVPWTPDARLLRARIT